MQTHRLPDRVPRLIALVNAGTTTRIDIALALRVLDETIECYDSMADFYRRCQRGKLRCLILVVAGVNPSATQLQKQLIGQGIVLPVIVVSTTANTQAAVEAIKQGAQAFLVNPDALTLQKTVAQLLNQIPPTAYQYRLNQLTQRESEILRFFVQGAHTRHIALRLGISYRTVDAHRTHILHKLQARSVSMLTYRLGKANLLQYLIQESAQLET